MAVLSPAIAAPGILRWATRKMTCCYKGLEKHGAHPVGVWPGVQVFGMSMCIYIYIYIYIYICVYSSVCAQYRCTLTV